MPINIEIDRPNFEREYVYCFKISNTINNNEGMRNRYNMGATFKGNTAIYAVDNINTNLKIDFVLIALLCFYIWYNIFRTGYFFQTSSHT